MYCHQCALFRVVWCLSSNFFLLFLVFEQKQKEEYEIVICKYNWIWCVQLRLCSSAGKFTHTTRVRECLLLLWVVRGWETGTKCNGARIETKRGVFTRTIIVMRIIVFRTSDRIFCSNFDENAERKKQQKCTRECVSVCVFNLKQANDFLSVGMHSDLCFGFSVPLGGFVAFPCIQHLYAEVCWFICILFPLLFKSRSFANTQTHRLTASTIATLEQQTQSTMFNSSKTTKKTSRWNGVVHFIK